MTFPIPDTALARHIAVVGETGAGKTHDTKSVVEHVVAQGYRVCILDTIKSDWWGITSSASGKSAGLPFKILGGPRGHVPLHSGAGKAIGQLVGDGKLPLSIIDMADFEPGGPQKFFEQFAQALWKHVRGVVYLVIEEAHELAPKERAGFGAENMAIHWAKKLATGSRTKGIRLIVASQRTQAVHNALLGSCGTLMAHSLSLPADQKPILEWLNANVRDKALRGTIADDLAFLPTGTAWVCCAKDNFFKKVHFPKIATFDNTATPDNDTDTFEVKTAPVDPEELRSIIGAAVKDAEANDPVALKKEIARLKAEVAKATSGNRQAAPDLSASNQAGEAAAHADGFSKGWENGHRQGFADGMVQAHTIHELNAVTIAKEMKKTGEAMRFGTYVPRPAPGAPKRAKNIPENITAPPVNRTTQINRATNANVDGLTQPQRKVLNAVGFWRAIGHEAPTREQVAAVAGYSPSSGGFNNLIGGLKTAGHLDIPQPGRVSLADGAYFEDMTADQARTKMRAVLSNPQLKLVDAALGLDQISRDDLGAATEYSPSSGGFNNLIGSLSTLGIFMKPAPGYVAVSDWAREVLG